MALATKDLQLLWRDKSALFWVLVFPLLIGILFGSIFGGGSENSAIGILVVDQDGSKESKAFIARLQKSDAVKVEAMDLEKAREAVRGGKKTAYIVLPKGYGESERTFNQGSGASIKVGIDPSKKAEAGMLEGVIQQAAYGGMQEMFSDKNSMTSNIRTTLDDPAAKLDANTRAFLENVDKYYSASGSGDSAGFKFEGPKIEKESVAAEGKTPASAYEVSFPQALVWGLLGVVTTFAISLVKERQLGTMLRLRVSPMSFTEILLGKGLACFFACVGVLVMLLGVGVLLFRMHVSSMPLLALAIVASGICFVGVMMLLSTLGRTEQAVSGSAWGVLIIMAMFGGGMIPLFAMPGWMQTASSISPIKWAVLGVEGALWRGFTFQEMLLPLGVLVGVGVVCFMIGVRVVSKARD